jgi:hypothetical protein
MTSLALRLHKHSVSTSMGAVAMLQRVADENGAAVRQGQRLDVIIPANSGGSTHHVAVEPGRWLVEATLPSGEVISEEVAVASGQDVPVTLHAAEHSPHEWLGWQHLVGNIEGAKTLTLLRDRAEEAVKTAAKTLGAKVDADKLIGKIDKLIDVAELLLDKAMEPPVVHLREKQVGLRGAEAWTRILALEPAAAGTVCSPSWEDRTDATWLYELTGPAQLPQRHFAHVEWLGERFAVSLPLPWRALSDHRPVAAQMMVRMRPLERNVQIGTVVQDPDFGTMAGLMTASTLPQAAIAVKQAQDMLFGKMLHPLGAAAGGYVLLAAGDAADSTWHGWIDNLDHLFPDIPDGAVLKASLRLRFPKTKDSPAEARAALLEAFDRGIPYYSAGVSWLLDGLTMFADDPAVEQKMKIVQRVALRLDLSQAFTVIRISDRVKR